MGELVVVRMKSDYVTEFLAADPEAPEPAAPGPVAHIHELTPYGMLLAGLGGCAGILLHSYAQSREIPLDEVELAIAYRRSHREDCENCEGDAAWEEAIEVELKLAGSLTQEQREKLLAVSRQCPVEKILRQGVAVSTRLIEAPAAIVLAPPPALPAVLPAPEPAKEKP